MILTKPKFLTMKKLFYSLCLIALGFTVSGQDAKKSFESAERHYSSGNYKSAIEDYTTAISIDPSYLNAYLRRAFCYSATKDYDGALSDYSKILELKPNHVWALNSRGSAYNKLKKYDLAMADFNKLLELEPKNTEALNNRGWTKQGLGNHQEACEDWKLSKKYGNEEAKIILKNTNCKK